MPKDKYRCILHIEAILDEYTTSSTRRRYVVIRQRLFTMTDYAGSPIALRNLQTGIRIDGMIVSLSEEEIKVSANKKIFTIMQDNTGRWHDAVNKQRFVMA